MQVIIEGMSHKKSSNHFAELEQDTGISKTTIGGIVTEDLKLKKTPAKFIPISLTNEKKLCRLATCEDMLEMTRTDPEWKDKIITGDETWIYGYDPETKRQSTEWRGQVVYVRRVLMFFPHADNKKQRQMLAQRVIGDGPWDGVRVVQAMITMGYGGVLSMMMEGVLLWRGDRSWADVLLEEVRGSSISVVGEYFFGITVQRSQCFMVGAGIFLGGRTALHIFRQEALTGQRYRDEILAAYVMPQAWEMGENFLLKDDNARPHRAGGLFEAGDDNLALSFRLAVDAINRNWEVLRNSRLSALVLPVKALDSFHAARKESLEEVHPRKTDTITFPADGSVLAFSGGGDPECLHYMDCCLYSGVK
ncbi:hypothetical protein LAZ67_11001878 [Cordylochernes scorpioides]|uniref:Uncharacterized protein n=1 Tax=Cordylochernes scorpioides TaxID=51811 RepID=A0ABY6KZG5_9ARAC|nr:hypothetical protein LAZ67_11001878 [Cordylochernes scorpioides]